MNALRARWGVSLLFFSNGALFSALLPRYPELKQQYGLSDSQFGLMVVAFPAGSLAAATLSAPLVRRFGARGVAGGSSAILALALVLAASSPTAALFAAAMGLAGVLDAIADGSQNVQAVAVEHWRSKSLINSMHALWSVGAAAGGAVGAWCAGQGISIQQQTLINGTVWAVLALVGSLMSATPSFGEEETASAAGDVSVPRSAWRLLAPLAVLAITGTLVEEVANSWVPLFLGRETSAAAGVAGAGFTVVLLAQFFGRLLGDPMTDRWGRYPVARAGSVLVVVGVGLAAVSTHTAPAMLGFAAMGFGCATLVPAAYAAAGRIPGLPRGTGIARLGWVMRLGTLTASPAIGAVAQLSGLRLALVVPATAGAATALVLSLRRLKQQGGSQ